MLTLLDTPGKPSVVVVTIIVLLVVVLLLLVVVFGGCGVFRGSDNGCQKRP